MKGVPLQGLPPGPQYDQALRYWLSAGLNAGVAEILRDSVIPMPSHPGANAVHVIVSTDELVTSGRSRMSATGVLPSTLNNSPSTTSGPWDVHPSGISPRPSG